MEDRKMKKTYQTPATQLMAIEEHSLLSSSPFKTSNDREVSGPPTSDGLPTGVGSTEETQDPFANKGQDGNTTRAKSGMIWDEW